MRMSGVLLFVKDLVEMTAFYRDLIGFRPVLETSQDDWVEFDAGGAAFVLHAIPRHIPDSVEIGVPPAARESASCKLIFAVDDPEAERARLLAAGVTILQRSWGAWDAVDPEGNVFGIRASS